MKKLILSALSAGLLFASAPAAPAAAAVAADINLHFGDTPRYYFARQPRTILIPDTPVYYVSGLDDYDMFQCNGMWYIDDGGYWYRAPSYRGPFVNVGYQSVPRVILNVPSAYAHQPYRPGVWRRDSRNDGGGNVYYRNNGGYYGGNTRWQDRRDSDQRWQDRQRSSDRSWSRDRGDSRDQGGWNKGHGNNGRGHGNGNGHGNGHGRGHDRDDDDD